MLKYPRLIDRTFSSLIEVCPGNYVYEVFLHRQFKVSESRSWQALDSNILHRASIITENITLAGVAESFVLYSINQKLLPEKLLDVGKEKAAILKMAVMLFSSKLYLLAVRRCSLRVTVPPANSPSYKLLQYCFSLQRLSDPLLSLFLSPF